MRKYHKKQRKTIKSYPVLTAIEPEKSDKYVKFKRRKKQVKLVEDMNERELRAK